MYTVRDLLNLIYDTSNDNISVGVNEALPAGTNAIGKLAANSGVDIGDVTLTAGTSAVGTVDDMRELVQLAADGKVKSHISRTGKLSEINQILDELEKGAYPGRAIIDNLAE